MSFLSEQYRPPGRSNRSGRAHADNDVFEGLPVKQWGQTVTHVSLAPPKPEVINGIDNDRWGEPPMPRDYQLLQPWTQQLLRLARSGKVGTKRSADADFPDDDKPEDEALPQTTQTSLDDRGYIAKKWKPIPEAQLEPEHKHFEFLAKRRKGLPSLYGPELASAASVPMRKTKVQKANADGEIAIYEVLVPEGQTVEGEVAPTTALADLKAVAAAPGTVIEGVGIANEEGVVVAEHLKPNIASRRPRPPKKKGGPGRGKKRVTFTNPDGTTYTTIVPNATKIVPQPGQTVTHVAKGQEPRADVSTATVDASAAPIEQGREDAEEGEAEGEGEGEGEGSDDDGEDGEDDDDKEDGELGDGDVPVPIFPPATNGDANQPLLTVEPAPLTLDLPYPGAAAHPPTATPPPILPRDASSSPDLPLSKTSHSRGASSSAPVATEALSAEEKEAPPEAAVEKEVSVPTSNPSAADVETFEDGDEDLLGGLEKSLGGQR